MNEEEIAYFQAQEDEYNSQHGACPNCGKTAHVSDLGKEPDGTVCCVNCYEEYRKSLSTQPSQE